MVAKTFKEMVLDVDEDVLIEFYAPWCTHCKALAPKYDELGKKLSDENVVIAKMDATANDVPEPFEVKGLVQTSIKFSKVAETCIYGAIF